ncbi:MAG: KamA family radical SAM protein [Nitrospirota bacterium]
MYDSDHDRAAASGADDHDERSGDFAGRADVVHALALDPDPDAPWQQAARLFPVRWPQSYLALAESQGPDGPVWRMGRPEPAELAVDPGDLADPVGEGERSPVPFVIRKHADRAVLLVTGRCHFYCRFCFRRGTPAGREPNAADLTRAITYLSAETALREVILSGGDPLVWSDGRLAALVRRVAALPHLTHLRVHTRAPVHYPERITSSLTTSLASRLSLRIVTHFNHPSEVGTASRRAVELLTRRGIRLLNQTVLLAGVNDDPGILATLCRDLSRLGVRPYYLHHPDRAPGNAAFRLSIARGRRIFAEMRRRLPASDLPAYVIDLPTGHGKVPVEELRPLDGGRYQWDDGLETVVIEEIPQTASAALPAGR